LEREIEYYRWILQSLETAQAILNGRATSSAQKRAGTTIANAITIDAARRAARGHHPDTGRDEPPAEQTKSGKPRKIARPGHSKARAMRERTAAFLDQFDRNEAREHTSAAKASGFDPHGVGAMLRHGYLAKARGGAGYLRTAKPYEI
jgi:hypothetical protein